MNSFYVLIVLFFLLLSAWAFEAEYQSVRKYYPGITLMEYILIKDKIRITPEER
tara:strand:+ start:790 stop:951 length:162 start_codon:yes stop_codon:yes gene_type:complete